SASVTTNATSRTWSESGFRPDISMATHSSRFSSTDGAAPAGASFCRCCCAIIGWALPEGGHAGLSCQVLGCSRFSHGPPTSAMTPALFTWIFLTLLTLNVGLKYWLATRQV